MDSSLYDENDNLGFECDEEEYDSDFVEPSDDEDLEISQTDIESDRLLVKHIRAEDVVKEMNIEIEKARGVIEVWLC